MCVWAGRAVLCACAVCGCTALHRPFYDRFQKFFSAAVSIQSPKSLLKVCSLPDDVLFLFGAQKEAWATVLSVSFSPRKGCTIVLYSNVCVLYAVCHVV